MSGTVRSSCAVPAVDKADGNILMFLPVGFLVVVYRYLGARSGDARPNLMAAIVGFLFSLGIETTQYVFGIGYSDINDVACNTLGAALAARVTKHLSRTTREEMCWGLTARNVALMLVLFDGLAKN